MVERIFRQIKAWHIIGAALLVYALTITPSVTTGGDDARYVLMSRDFAGTGVLPSMLTSSVFESQCYSLLPLLLVPFAQHAPDNFALMKIVPFVASALALFFIYRFVCFFVPADGRMRKALLFLCAFNPWVVEYSTLLLTEMLFMLLSMAVVVFMRRYRSEPRKIFFVTATLCCALSLYARPSGIALTAAFVMYLAIQRNARELLAAGCLLAVAGGLFFARLPLLLKGSLIQVLTREQYYSPSVSADGLLSLPARMAYHGIVYAGNYIPDIFVRPFVWFIDPRVAAGAVNPFFFLKFFIGIVFVAAIGRGYVRTLRAGWGFEHVYAVVYGMFCLALNAYVARYLVPLVPLMILWLVEGARCARRKQFSRRVVMGTCVLLAVVSGIGSGVEIWKARSGYMRPEEQRFIACNRWIRENTARDAVILSRKPFYTKLVTGRTPVGYRFLPRDDDQFTFIMQANVGYVITADDGCFLHSGALMKRMITRYPDHFVQVYVTESSPHEYVYKVNKS